ncbi:glycine--tRNA ligase subunit beta [Altererythrobacter sp. B11]|uniref:glycine--tRNA ligase subunit beta n=1 Tax=Altererythrobacter sp. B11 TaxID=2060312 RepID=UPI000DC72AD2|nr:glycine--tRNA ligase subunit beta [Altererythrobacter sp. B11]BBC73077.1 glycine--tRNA ligase subunit beta [Altererythrobacter sp. B11]
MSDFLLELRCEEIPARMQKGARADLEKLFRAELQAAGLAPGAITVWSTPRRLALIARDLPDQTEAVREETKGPAIGAPAQALEGFLRKTGLRQDQLEIRDLKGKDTYFAVVEKPGRAVKDVLAEAIPAIIRAFPWPKSMRWGAASLSTESLRWVRPLSGIVAILGEELVECEVGGVPSGYATVGHRFHHPGAITIGGADDYAQKLRACHVIVDQAEREAIIREGATRAAAEAGLTLVEDEGLVVENAGLTEWPVPLLGRFDEAFLQVPPEVIQLTARVNQKYFVCEDAAGTLANAFVCTANIEARDGGTAIVDGNRKVLAARLSDARFFWDVDRKVPLEEQAKKLERITFHEKLGTVADKVERVARLARWLVEEGVVTPAQAGAQNGDEQPGHLDSRLRGNDEGVVELADMAEQAARLCKADLVTEMVGEFPELQGLMGGYYAREQGLPVEVAEAIRDHYKPVGQGDDVPTAPVTVAVSLADKLDTIAGFFLIEQAPTGSKDPFGLRRSAIAVCSLVLGNESRLPVLVTLMNCVIGYVETALAWAARSSFALGEATQSADLWKQMARSGQYAPAVRDALAHLEEVNVGATAAKELLARLRDLSAHDVVHRADEAKLFIVDRLKVQQREAGVRHDLIDAVFSLGGEDDLVRLLAGVNALQSYVETAEGANLLAAYKRAANILKKEEWEGTEGEIAQTGEEDPLALVDDPDLKAVIDAKMTERRGRELSYTPEPAEKALIEALDAAEPRAAAAIEAEDFAAAMAALAGLRAPIDRFFDEVTVNVPEQDKRASRLDLLDRFRAAVHKVADFSRIEG